VRRHRLGLFVQAWSLYDIGSYAQLDDCEPLSHSAKPLLTGLLVSPPAQVPLAQPQLGVGGGPFRADPAGDLLDPDMPVQPVGGGDEGCLADAALAGGNPVIEMGRAQVRPLQQGRKCLTRAPNDGAWTLSMDRRGYRAL